MIFEHDENTRRRDGVLINSGLIVEHVEGRVIMEENTNFRYTLSGYLVIKLYKNMTRVPIL